MAQQKIATGNLQAPIRIAWKSMRDMAVAFKAVREEVGEVVYREELERYGWHSFEEMRNAIDTKKVPNVKEQVAECYRRLDAIARKGVY